MTTKKETVSATEYAEIPEVNYFAPSATFTDGLMVASAFSGLWALIAILLQWGSQIYLDGWASVAVLTTVLIIGTVLARMRELESDS